MRVATFALVALVVTACTSQADRDIAAARNDAVNTMRSAGCDLNVTIELRPDVQAQCNEVRRVCYDGPLPELRATARACEEATTALTTLATTTPSGQR